MLLSSFDGKLANMKWLNNSGKTQRSPAVASGRTNDSFKVKSGTRAGLTHKLDKLVLRAPNCLGGPRRERSQKSVALMSIMTVKTRNENDLASARIIPVDNDNDEDL
jgi:hypothetical protein